MKQYFLAFLILILFFISCDKPPIEKPENLIKENEMIEMMVDVHLAQATYVARQLSDSLVKKSSAADFYYSALEKYNVPDSVFEKSFVYYASNPKNFEKMYRKVMNKLSEMEQEYSGRKNELIELDAIEKQ